MPDDFNGDNAHLIRSAQALLDLDAAGALVPHGIGGHARSIIESFIARLPTTEYVTDHSVDPSWEDD